MPRGIPKWKEEQQKTDWQQLQPRIEYDSKTSCFRLLGMKLDLTDDATVAEVLRRINVSGRLNNT